MSKNTLTTLGIITAFAACLSIIGAIVLLNYQLTYQQQGINQLLNTGQQTSQQYQQVSSDQITATAQAGIDQATAQAAQATASTISNEQNTLSNDLSSMNGVLSSMKTDSDFTTVLGQYSTDMSTMQSDYQKEQSDATGGCTNQGNVGYDLGTVQYDNGSIQYDDGSLKYAVNSLQTDISNAQGYMQQIRQLWSALNQQAPGIAQSDIDTALQNGSNAVSQANTNQQDAQNKASGFDASAKQLLSQATSLYNGMHC